MQKLKNSLNITNHIAAKNREQNHKSLSQISIYFTIAFFCEEIEVLHNTFILLSIY